MFSILEDLNYDIAHILSKLSLENGFAAKLFHTWILTDMACVVYFIALVSVQT